MMVEALQGQTVLAEPMKIKHNILGELGGILS